MFPSSLVLRYAQVLKLHVLISMCDLITIRVHYILHFLKLLIFYNLKLCTYMSTARP